MALLDLPTRQDYETLAGKLDALLARLAPAPAPASAEPLLSVEDVAGYTRFDRRTVEQWATEGRFNTAGKRVYLPAYQFSGRLRFKRHEVEAFGLGCGVLTPSLVAGDRPQPTKAAAGAKPRRPKMAPPALEQVLRVA